MGRRLQLEKCHIVLDCGCGRGHWSRVLAGTLPPDAVIVGVDKESEWIADAAASSRRAGLQHRFRFQQGLVEDLQFEEASCDLVTCQTLLIHVFDPKRVLREMLRVLKPGGLLLVAEPNNLSFCLKWNSLRAEDYLNGEKGIDELMRLVRFHVLCEKGKLAVGEGFNSVGDLLPGLFAELGLDDIQVFQSDMAAALFPPYGTPRQRANITDTLKRVEEGFFGWRENEARRYFVAGGGTAAEFSEFWQWALADNARLHAAIERRRYHAADGFSMYLVSGRKN